MLWGGARGLPRIPQLSSVVLVLVWVLLSFLFLLRLIRSHWGRSVLALREDALAAGAMGISVFWKKIQVFVLSAFFSGVAGGLFAHAQGFIDPNNFNFNRSVEMVMMVVLGGMGSFSGAAFGAIVITILPEMLRFLQDFRLVLFPVVLMVLMLERPSGCFGDYEIWDFFSSWWGRRQKKVKV